MGFLDGIEKIRNGDFILSILAILLLFSPGVGYIFYFWRELFISLDIFKLLFLSLTITAPFILLSFFLIGILLDSDKNEHWDKDSQIFASLAIGIFFSAIILYIGLAISVCLKISFISSIILSLVIFTLLALMLFLSELLNSKSKK